jgi:non-specific serine/threonine protein kinase
MFGPGGLSTFAPSHLLAGRLAALTGKRDAALAHYEKALAFAKELGARAFVLNTERALSQLGETVKPKPAPAAAVALERRGEMWSFTSGRRTVLMKDTKGFTYLDALLRAPHREVHVLELAGAEEAGDAGPLLDDRAKQEYRARAADLRNELEEATRNNDVGRVERIRNELDALAGELTRALGLGGKDRRAASTTERARINVQRRLKDAIRRVSAEDDELGRHLELSIKTGTFCMYAPTWP